MRVRVDGREVFVHTGGEEFDPARPAIVLVHGAGMDHSVWRYQTRRLVGAGHAAVAPDLPGHGKSEGDALRSVPEMGAWLGRLFDALGVDAPVVGGHSMGSLIALSVASHRTVAGVMLAATSDRMAVHPRLLAAAEAADHLAVDLIVGWSHTGADRFGGHAEPGTWKRAFSERLLERHLEGPLAVDLRAVAAHDPVADAVDVRCPALVVVGEADRMTPARAGLALASELRGETTILQVPGGSHVAHIEQPELVTGAMLDWLGAPVPR